MIYRRENPTTPSKRFRTTILNPLGNKSIRKFSYKWHSNLVGKHNGTKVCLRRKKSEYKSKFNLYYGMHQSKPATVSEISISRRYKTFVGLVTYSNGAISSIPLFSGASIGSTLKIIKYLKTPKTYFFSRARAGYYIPIAYLSVTNCFFNVSYSWKKFSWFCKAAGTFCTILRLNIDKGYFTVKLPSNKHWLITESSYVMLGRNSNILPKGILVGKAGVNIIRGFRPSVRGVAKNPVDHPHGGRTKTNAPERTPWGRVAKFNK